ncbi:heterokaryon incompatibility protein-domain-containing protein [Annulohypoxylon truncatum]|uniref:heterokaryon incompatibility protein-domain-containing protein n=1 Tax=Annulohypoxylon truncatum TaxID=327061 RepID=UPI0020072CC8|nr:heterokaryon incompatibility protein-domain-containing protein [Annulohypoxylon truncatum]KAI1208621.1 heterokaryon incompatibility protein-domain-containing protein [Annulohypoxylon truncatum]
MIESLPDFLQGLPSEITCAIGSECSFTFRSFARLQISSRYTWTSYAGFEIDDGYGTLDNLYFFARERKGARYLVADNTNSQQTWQYITDRLENCENNHKSCQQSPNTLPSRLIEIKEEEEGKLHFRLVLTSNSGFRGRYITLSHRWGTNATLTLTSRNLSDFMVQIPQHELPIKYVDAAVLALRLKIPYLWIDSLCIIQDSSDDWDRESGTMDLVYRNAYCNLAATSAMRSSEGLFYKRSPSQVCPHEVHLPKMGDTLVFDRNDQTVLVDLDEEPLNLRAWVCQERLLSTRNISFSRRLVYYECAEEINCELVGGALSPCGLRYDPACRNLWSLTFLRNMPFDDVQTFWHKVIGFYTNSNLTKRSDKLVAVSGIAKFCQPAFGSDYLAGLWISNLTRDLCWHSQNDLQHVSDYRAPSWSWASVVGKVSYRPIGDYGNLVDFIDMYSTPVVRTNPYGAVQDSRIRLSGFVFPVFHKGCNSCEYQPGQIRGHGTRPFHLRVSFASNTLLNGWAHFVQIDDHALGNSKPNAPSLLEPMDCFFLPILCESEYDYCTELRLYCLILAAVTPSRGIYQRIGLLDFIFNPTDDGNWAALGSPLREDPTSLEEMVECVLLILEHKFQHCKVPSHGGHTLQRHEIILV